MNITSGLINGLLLLARLYLNSKAEVYDSEVFFNILVEDNKEISDEDKQSLEKWGWRLSTYKGLDVYFLASI